jgi:hypothetical protein
MLINSKSMITTLLLVMFLCGTAVASDSRITAMGDAGDYMEDPFNTLHWYGTLPAYGSILFLELGTLDTAGETEQLEDSGLGLNLDLGREGRLGTAGLFLTGADDTNPQGGSAGIYWGIGHRHQFGLMLRYRDSEQASDHDGTGYRNLRAQHDLTIGTGLRLEMGSKTYVDLAYDLTGTDRKLVENGWLMLDDQDNYQTWSFRMRIFRSLGPNLALVPFFSNRHLEQSWIDPDAAISASLTDKNRRAGVGFNYFPDADSMFLLAVEYTDITGTLDPTYDITGIQKPIWNSERFAFVVGMESRVRSWLTLRAGARASVGTDEDYPPLESITTYIGSGHGIGQVDRDMDLTLGLALHLGRFDLDMVLNSEPLFHMGNFLTGDDGSAEANISSVSLTYLF